MEAASLRELGRNVILQFGAVFLALSTKPYEERNSEEGIERCRENIDAEHERFQLWAANLGLQATGDRSLDYRVQDSASVKSYTKQLLEELGDDLVDLSKLLKKEPAEPYTEQSTKLEEEEEDEGDEESEACADTEETEDDTDDNESKPDLGDDADEDMESVTLGTTFEAIEAMIDDVSDIIDRLYRLASKLRNTATRAPPSARNFYRESLIDADGSEIYLTSSERQAAKDQCEELHRQRIEELIRQSMRDECGDPFPKEDNSPDLSPRTRAVIQRIARANAYRQQQFAFWRTREWDRRQAVKYQTTTIQLPLNLARKEEEQKQPNPQIPLDAKAAKKPILEAPAKSRVVFSEVPSATWKMVKEPTLAGLDEIRSLSSKTEFTSSPTIYEPGGRKVGWPAFPKELGKKKDFICPYCFVTCPANYRGKAHWRAHLIQDLQPYTCLAEHCQEGDNKLLNTWEEWIVHEQVHHRMEYSCPNHPEKMLLDRESYTSHVKQDHPDIQDELLTVDGYNSNANIPPCPKSGCPLCSYESETWADMDKHLAYHLENLALLSLPLATGLEKENTAMGSLQLEGGEDDEINLLDEDVAGALSSLFETQSTEVFEEGIPSMPSEGLTQAALSNFLNHGGKDSLLSKIFKKWVASFDKNRFDFETLVYPYEAMVPWDMKYIRETFPRAKLVINLRLAMANTKRRRRIDLIHGSIKQSETWEEGERQRVLNETKNHVVQGKIVPFVKDELQKTVDNMEAKKSIDNIAIEEMLMQAQGLDQTPQATSKGEENYSDPGKISRWLETRLSAMSNIEDKDPGSVNIPASESSSILDIQSHYKLRILEHAWYSRHFRKYEVGRLHECPLCSFRSDDKDVMLHHLKEYLAPYICVENGCESTLFSSVDDWVTHMYSHWGSIPFLCPLCKIELVSREHPEHILNCLRRASAVVIPRIFCPWSDSESDISGSIDVEFTDEAAYERQHDFSRNGSMLLPPLPREWDWDTLDFDDYLDPEYDEYPLTFEVSEYSQFRPRMLTEMSRSFQEPILIKLTDDAIAAFNSNTTPVPILESWLQNAPAEDEKSDQNPASPSLTEVEGKKETQDRFGSYERERIQESERDHTTRKPFVFTRPPSRRQASGSYLADDEDVEDWTENWEEEIEEFREVFRKNFKEGQAAEVSHYTLPPLAGLSQTSKLSLLATTAPATPQPPSGTTSSSNTNTHPAQTPSHDKLKQDLPTESNLPQDYQFNFTSPVDPSHWPQKDLFTKTSRRAIVLHEFLPVHDNELPLIQYQIIDIFGRCGNGWLLAQDPKTGKRGLVPGYYVWMMDA